MSTQMALQRIHLLAEEIGTEREQLLPLLEAIDREFHFLDEIVINEVAKIFNLSQTEVYSIASFYHLLNTKPSGTYVIRLCRTIGCDLQGKDNIVKALEAELGIKVGETTPDRKYSLQFANCMGMCDAGPAMLVNSDLHANLTPSRAVDIIHRYN